MENEKMINRKFLILTFAISVLVAFTFCISGCTSKSTAPVQNGTRNDIAAQEEIASELSRTQATPTDIDYSLERYNLIRRAYWVNGQREKANTLICEIDKPLGYIVLFSGNAIVSSFVVDGKVSSLNSFLTPDGVDSIKGNGSCGYTTITTELADVDGSYGENDSGIFFFTPDGKYIEWTGTYLYSDIPFKVDSPVVNYEVSEP